MFFIPKYLWSAVLASTLFFGSFFSQTYASQHAVNPLDKIINEGQQQLTKIHISLNSIASLIRKNKRYSSQIKEQILNHFRELDQIIIKNLSHEKFIQITIENAYILLHINSILIDHINQLMNNNFKGLQTFSIQSLIEKAGAQKRTVLQPQKILMQLVSNDKKIDALMKRALGLTWYNKLARTIDNFIITPTQRYALVRRSLLTAGTLFLGSYFAWQLFHDQFETFMVGMEEKEDKDSTNANGQSKSNDKDTPKVNNKNKIDEEKLAWWRKNITRPIYTNLYGPLPKINGSVNEITNSNDLALLGKIDYFCFKWTHDLTTIGRTIVALLSVKFAYEFKNTFYPKLKKYSAVIKNWLKGGSYLKEAERAAEKIEPVRFEEIYGQDEIKKYMQLIVDYLEDPETFDRLGLTPPKGILCIGDTRTGKTFMINALFGEINEMLKRTSQTGKFKLIKLDVLSIKIEGMETILRKVRANAPCIVFIDEIDLLDLQRTGENRTLSEFLTSMSDALGTKDSKKQVIIIAATNRPETLDTALRQPGRFGKELRFEYPNYTDRYKFIMARLKELSLTSKQFDIKTIAQCTQNKSYEALSMLIKDAIIKARLRNEILTQTHLDESLDEDIYHIIPNYTKDIPAKELEILAAHFSGQALLLSLLPTNVKLAKVTIKQVMTELKEEVMGKHLYDHKSEQERFEYGRIFTYHPSDSINLINREEKLVLCKMYCAGLISEELLLGSSGYSCHAHDNEKALELAQSIAFEGSEIASLPKHMQKQKHDQALTIIAQCKKETHEWLRKNKKTLDALYAALLEHKTLNKEQVKRIIDAETNRSGQKK